jgi:hypothetical protein
MQTNPELAQRMGLMQTAPDPGVLGRRQPQQQQQQQGGTGVGGALNRLLSGGSERDNSALMQAGLAGLAANSQGGSALDSMVAMAQGGQAQGLQNRELNLQNQQQAAIQGIVGAGGENIEVLRNLFQQSIANGDMDMTRSLAEVLKVAENRVNPPQNQAPTRGTPEYIQALRDELELREEFENPPVERSPVRGSPEYMEMLEEEERLRAGFRPDSAGSEGERKAAAFLGFIPSAIQTIDAIMDAPGRVEQALSDVGLREFVGDEQQQLALAGAQMAEAWLRMTTGAAYNEREFDTAYQLFVPRPGDTSGAIRAKKANREQLMTMLRTSAGRLAPPPPSLDSITGR